MTKFQRFMLTRITKQLVVQGPAHENNIVEMYKIIRQAIADEFNEDSPIGQDHYTWEQFEKAQLFPAIKDGVNPDDVDEKLIAMVAKARWGILDSKKTTVDTDEELEEAIAIARKELQKR